MSNDLKRDMAILIKAAADLANSIEADIKRDRSISGTTVIYLSQFDSKLQDLKTALDILNGIN